MKYKVFLLFFSAITSVQLSINACEPDGSYRVGMWKTMTPCKGKYCTHPDHYPSKTHSTPNSPTSKPTGQRHSTSVPTGLSAIPEGNIAPQSDVMHVSLPGQIEDETEPDQDPETKKIYHDPRKTCSAPTTPHISPSSSWGSEDGQEESISNEIKIAYLEDQLKKIKQELQSCSRELLKQQEQNQQGIEKRLNDLDKQKERLSNLARRYDDHCDSCFVLLCECKQSNTDCRADVQKQTRWHDNLETRIATLEKTMADALNALPEIQNTLVKVGANERKLQNAYDHLTQKNNAGAINEPTIPDIASQTSNDSKNKWHLKHLFTCCLRGSQRNEDQ